MCLTHIRVRHLEGVFTLPIIQIVSTYLISNLCKQNIDTKSVKVMADSDTKILNMQSEIVKVEKCH